MWLGTEEMVSQLMGMIGSLEKEIGKLMGAVEGINTRLDKLNGSVARHENCITEMQLAKAEKRGGEAVKKSFLSKAWDIGKVPISLFLGAVCSPLFQKFGEAIGKWVR